MSGINTSSPGRVPPAWAPRWARHVGRIFCGALWRVEVYGAENIPANGRVIVAANHAALIDGPLMMGFVPRPTHFLVKGAFFKGPVGWVLRACGQIPVRPGVGRSALAAGRGVLLRDGCVGIFPEGRRGRGDVARLHPGVGWLSLHTNTPVVPVAVLGTRMTGRSVHALPRLRARIVVQYGLPVMPVDCGDEPSRRDISDMTDHVRVAMSELLSEAQRQHGIFIPADEGTTRPRSSNV